MSTHLDPFPSSQQESSAVSKDCNNFKMSSDFQKRYPSSVSEVPFSARAPMTEVPASSNENPLRINELTVFGFLSVSLVWVHCQRFLSPTQGRFAVSSQSGHEWLFLGSPREQLDEHGFEGLQKVPPSLLAQGLSWLNFCQINASVDLRPKNCTENLPVRIQNGLDPTDETIVSRIREYLH